MDDVPRHHPEIPPAPESLRTLLICGACNAVAQATQVPDFCGRCSSIAPPFLTLRTVVDTSAGASVRVRMEHAFHGAWEAPKRAAWEVRLGGET